MARTKRAKKQHPVAPLMGAKILDKRAEDLKQKIWECKEQNYPFEGMGILVDCENKPLPFTPTAVRTDFTRTDPAWTLKRYNTWLRDLDAEIGRLEVLAASAKSLYKDTKTSLRAVTVVKLQSKQILAERRLIALRLGAALQQAKSLKALLEYEKSNQETETDDETDDVKGHRKAHVRRAHWHKYWIGSRKAEKRECILHFLPPILVGSGELGFSVVNVDADEDYLPEVEDEDE